MTDQKLDITSIRARSAEALRPSSSWAYALASAEDVPALLAEVEAQFAGRWVTEFVVVNAADEVQFLVGAYETVEEATEDLHLYPGERVTTRRVWYGPVEPVPTSDTTEATS